MKYILSICLFVLISLNCKAQWIGASRFKVETDIIVYDEEDTVHPNDSTIAYFDDRWEWFYTFDNTDTCVAISVIVPDEDVYGLTFWTADQLDMKPVKGKDFAWQNDDELMIVQNTNKEGLSIISVFSLYWLMK